MTKIVVTFYELKEKVRIDQAGYFKFHILYCANHQNIPALYDAVKNIKTEGDEFTSQFKPISFEFPSIDREVTILHSKIENERDAIGLAEQIRDHFPDAEHLAIVTLGSFFYNMPEYSEYDVLYRKDEYYYLPNELIQEFEKRGINVMFINGHEKYDCQERTFKRAISGPELKFLDLYPASVKSKCFSRIGELDDETLQKFFDYLLRSSFVNRQFFGEVLLFACPDIYLNAFGNTTKTGDSKGQYSKKGEKIDQL